MIMINVPNRYADLEQSGEGLLEGPLLEEALQSLSSQDEVVSMETLQ